MGSYRKGEAADPEVYVTSVATVLTRYPATVARYVTDPVHGLPGKTNWLPTIAEVRAACEAEMKPRYEQMARLKRYHESQKLLAAPEMPDAETRAKAVERWEKQIRPEMLAWHNEVASQKSKETPEAALERLMATKDTPVTVGSELLKKIEQIKAGA